MKREMSPRVSVVMAVYNAAGHLAEAVESILGQTLDDFEFFIVDDGSTDATPAILDSYRDPRIVRIDGGENRGVAASVNQALAQARGEYVARMDADDMSDAARLEKQVRFLDAHENVTVLGSALRIIDERGVCRGRRDYPLEHDAIVRAMPMYNPVAQPAVMWRWNGGRAPFLIRYRDHIVEDYDLWSRLALRGAVFANLPEPLVRYRIHAGAQKWSKLRASLRGTLDVKRTYWMTEMGLRGRLRMVAERLLMYLPPGLVVRLFLQGHVKRHRRRRSAQ